MLPKMAILSAKNNTTKLVYMAILVCLITVLGFTPIGMIPLPFVKITIVHIPVIIGACLLGAKRGGALGFSFGLVSFLNATFVSPTPMSFMFTPFYNIGDIHGNLYSLLICFVPRILVGVVAGLVFDVFSKKRRYILAAIFAAIAGTLTNTMLVLGGFWMFFSEQIQTLMGQSIKVFIIGILSTNSVAELIAAIILTAAIIKPVLKINKI